MRIIAWNILHGGGTRVARIVEEIAAYDPDVFAVTEYRTKPGVALGAALKERGLSHVETTGATENKNGIAVFSATPLRRMRCPAPEGCAERWLDLELPEHGFAMSVLHIMAAGSGTRHPTNVAKVRFWEAVLRASKSRVRKPFLFLGDWNTGAHGVDETGKTFVCADHFCKLSTLGWTDMWRHHHPHLTEWTWYSTLKGGVRGNGFRLDHAFASPSLKPRIVGCRYSHREREAKISDHSLLILDVD